MGHNMDLFDFHSIRPPFETSQGDTFEWLVAAHRRSDGTEVGERLGKVGCKPDRIAKRGCVTRDFLHRDWEKMEIFRLHEVPAGLGLDVRVGIYARHVEQVFEEFYPSEIAAPDDLIHVTCTGYVSPSGAQKLVSKRGWGEKTTVTHAYHMGCYGSIPALRMARGFFCSDRKERIDIVHTEICSIHANPSLHTSDQLVSQSLFADGFIKYSMGQNKGKGALRLLSTREEIIPGSTQAMTWDVVNWGFAMSLSKEVPVLIARTLKQYLERMAQGGKWSIEELCKKALFAVHPGGPKILLYVQEILGLTDAQMKHSFQILEQYGNMSSATLPHIWKEMLAETEEGTPIVSLAFGPGLTICGAILEVNCS
jgi:predicted naringenin-chalcone synthase